MDFHARYFGDLMNFCMKLLLLCLFLEPFVYASAGWLIAIGKLSGTRYRGIGISELSGYRGIGVMNYRGIASIGQAAL